MTDPRLPRGLALPLACAVLGAALLAAAWQLRAGAAALRERASRVRAEAATLRPDAESALAEADATRRLVGAPAPASAPAEHLALAGVSAAAPAVRDRPLRGGAPVVVRETELSCPSADPAALSRALGAAAADGHRLVSLELDPVSNGRVKARLRFLSFLPSPAP